jgi:hypothetical protein
MTDAWYEAAAWVQAVGTIAAVAGSAWLAAGESRAVRRRDREAQLAVETAALNLAIMAHTLVRNLHELLRDETRRGRLNHISPSRSFAANQQMMTGFPIHSLADPAAMIAFAYFPGSLSMAAEIYGHLEEAVRTAEEENPAEVFAHYANQLEMIERHLDERLAELKAALRLPEGDGRPTRTDMPRMMRHISRKARTRKTPET